MNSLLAFAKDSAKKSFQKLREEEFFYCNSLDKDIFITKSFFQHVIFKQGKQRTSYEIMERILVFPFIAEVIQSGTCMENRKFEEMSFHQVSKKYKNYVLSVIIQKRLTTGKYTLLSCFKNHKKKNSSLVFPQ